MFIFAILSFLICEVGYSKAVLEIEIKDCKNSYMKHTINEFDIFKSNTHYQRVSITNKKEMVISDLDNGDYEIRYSSSFGDSNTIKVNITESKVYYATICTNYFDYDSDSYETFISKLIENEYFTIEFNTPGCFGPVEIFLTIAKRNGKYYCIQDSIENKLTIEKIEIIDKFEKELQRIKKFKNNKTCNNREIYTLKFKDEMIRINDNSCFWGGIFKLMDELELKY